MGRFDEIELSSLQRVSGDVNVEGAVFGSNDRARWTFTYTAPAKDTGRISFHLGAVSGENGTSQGEGQPTDPFGDDVFVIAQRSCEQFTNCDTTFVVPEETVSPVGHGCSIAAPASPTRTGTEWLLLAVGILAFRQRR